MFDDGSFSENETFLITDFQAHTRDVPAKNFGVPATVFRDLPEDVEHDRYIFGTALPARFRTTRCGRRRLRAQLVQPPPHGSRSSAAGCASWTRRPSRRLRRSPRRSCQVNPGGLRELHWHPNTAEWQYYIPGRGRMTVFASSEKARTFDDQAGDVGYVPFAMGHYVENNGDEPLGFLEMFGSSRFADISLTQWMALTPHELVRAHLNVDRRMIDAPPEDKPVIVSSPPPEREARCPTGRTAPSQS